MLTKLIRRKRRHIHSKLEAAIIIRIPYRIIKIRRLLKTNAKNQYLANVWTWMLGFLGLFCCCCCWLAINQSVKIIRNHNRYCLHWFHFFSTNKRIFSIKLFKSKWNIILIRINNGFFGSNLQNIWYNLTGQWNSNRNGILK